MSKNFVGLLYGTKSQHRAYREILLLIAILMQNRISTVPSLHMENGSTTTHTLFIRVVNMFRRSVPVADVLVRQCLRTGAL